MSSVGVAVLVGTLVLATAVGLVRRARDGRVRTRRGAAGPGELRPVGAERVLLLQLSSPACTPCRQTAAVLTELVARTPGLAHREIDVAERPDIARDLHVLRTPTVVALDRAGSEVLRVSGVPRVSDLVTGLGPALGPAP